MSIQFIYPDSDNAGVRVEYRVERCRRCILSTNFPNINFNEAGICNFCRAPEGQGLSKAEHETVFLEVKKRIASSAGRTHDCLVLYSGGKDSSYSLYLIKKTLGLNPLAVTIDNGFVADETFSNMRNLTQALEIEHLIVKPAPLMMRSLYRDAIEKTEQNKSNVMYATSSCGRCIAVVLSTGVQEAVKRNIPFLMGGWSPGQLTQHPLLSGAFLEEISKKNLSHVRLNSSEAQDFLKQYTNIPSQFPDLYNPLYAIDYNEEKVIESLTPYGWVKPKNTDSCSSNCLLNGLLIIDHIKKYGFHPYEYELAFHVRNGLSTREQALGRITNLSISEGQVRQMKQRLELSSEKSS